MISPDVTKILYVQVKNHIIDSINNGIWQEGDKLPTENDLQNEFKMSRATIRHALSEVEHEGYIERHAGKGTIVRHKLPKPEIMKLNSFTDDMISRGMTPQSKTIDINFVIPPDQVREGYGIATDEKVWLVQRLRLADGIPMGLQDLYIPPEMQISARELWQMQSYYQFLKENNNLLPASAHEILTAEKASKQDAEIMQICEGDPLISIWRATFAEDDSIIEMVKIKYIAERYEYHIKLYI